MGISEINLVHAATVPGHLFRMFSLVYIILIIINEIISMNI